MDSRVITPPLPDEEEHLTHSPEEQEHFPSLGGGVPSPFIFREDNNESSSEEETPEDEETEKEELELQPEVSGDDVSGKAVPDTDPEDAEEESDDEVVQQPIPFHRWVLLPWLKKEK